ncbi:MAG: hypothetical protein TRG1_1956 [Flavobacteriaceae bacterium FS1-H7996/R]|nr:MAG: hypothetical protein TRG1_1956 [Flavobacteriaceae bacterium FS1-H7996/R]
MLAVFFVFRHLDSLLSLKSLHNYNCSETYQITAKQEQVDNFHIRIFKNHS